MIPLRLGEIATIVGGALHGGAAPMTVVTGPVVADSRRAAAGGMFVCLPGDRHDGHDYAPAAVQAGAVAVLAARPLTVPAVVVPDTLEALTALARDAVRRGAWRTVGVTGSSGKTSTKDLLREVFATGGPTVAPEASYNNEIGLPLTVLQADASTATLVLEYSARGRGHIRHLCGIARPDIALVLNVGSAHLGEFGSREAIAEAKGELVEALPAAGTAVLNADDPLVAAMARRTAATTVTFGSAGDADVRIRSVEVDAEARPRLRLATPAGEVGLVLHLHGSHHALNAAAVVAAGLAGGLPLGDIVEGLEQARPRSAHRMAVHRRADGLVVVDDAYNANPESVRAALDALARMGSGRRTWAVLGEMRELGADSERLHREVGARLAAAGVAELVTVGRSAAVIAEGARAVAGWTGHAQHVDDAADAAALLCAQVAPGDVVLVKASNTLQLWKVAEALVSATAAAGVGS